MEQTITGCNAIFGLRGIVRFGNGMMAPSPPPRSADEDDPRPGHTQEEAV